MPFTLTMPKLSPTMEEGTLTKWHVTIGSLVKEGDLLFEVATDKATVEHHALDPGFLRKILIEEGKEAQVNQAVAIFSEKLEESIEGYQPEGIILEVKKPLSQEEPPLPTASVETPKGSSFFKEPQFTPEPPLEEYHFPHPEQEVFSASPLARKLAQEKNIDLSTITGSGPHNRIMSRDLPKGQADTLVAFGRRETPSLPPGSYEETPLTPLRKVIGQRLQESKMFIPHFYVMQEIDAEPMVKVREQLKTVGIAVSFNDLVIRACALALRKHPRLNSGFNSVSSSIIQFQTIDIAVAVSIEGGLITPIVRHADYKNVGQISVEVRQLAQRAREGKLERKEYKGGSFTISNLGMYGVSEFIGVINPPQAALLAVGGIEEKAVVKEGSLAIGKTMKVALSADHRVVDGADAAVFLKTLQKFLENPAMLLI